MAILGTEQTSKLSTGGVTQDNQDILRSSNLHDLASLSGQGLPQVNPAITRLQPANPSELDLNNGGLPEGGTYRDNAPEGASF
jgi:hypothetical protein